MLARQLVKYSMGNKMVIEFSRKKPSIEFGGAEKGSEKAIRNLSEQERAAFAKITKKLGRPWAGEVLAESISLELWRKDILREYTKREAALEKANVTKETRAELENEGLLPETRIPETRLTVDGFVKTTKEKGSSLMPWDALGLGKDVALLLPTGLGVWGVAMIPAAAVFYLLSRIGGLVTGIISSAIAMTLFEEVISPRVVKSALNRKAERTVEDRDAISLVVSVLGEVAESFFQKKGNGRAKEQ